MLLPTRRDRLLRVSSTGKMLTSSVRHLQEKSKDGSAPKMRIVAYNGDWSCECSKVNRLWDTCACSQAGPCRDWVRGRCKYGQECR